MDIETKLAELTQKLDAVYVSVEKTRNYLKWTLIGTIVAFVLPLLAAMFIVPSFLSQYTETLNSLVQ
jgi:hypothetical protein